MIDLAHHDIYLRPNWSRTVDNMEATTPFIQLHVGLSWRQLTMLEAHHLESVLHSMLMELDSNPTGATTGATQ